MPSLANNIWSEEQSPPRVHETGFPDFSKLSIHQPLRYYNIAYIKADSSSPRWHELGLEIGLLVTYSAFALDTLHVVYICMNQFPLFFSMDIKMFWHLTKCLPRPRSCVLALIWFCNDSHMLCEFQHGPFQNIYESWIF